MSADIKTWQERMRDPGNEFGSQHDCMRDEIVELRSKALALRAELASRPAVVSEGQAVAEALVARMQAISKAGFELSAALTNVPEATGRNSKDFIRRDAVMALVVEWRQKMDAAPKVDLRAALARPAAPAPEAPTAAPSARTLSDAEIIAVMDAAQSEWGAGNVDGGLRLHVIKSVLKYIAATNVATAAQAPEVAAQDGELAVGDTVKLLDVDWLDGEDYANKTGTVSRLDPDGMDGVVEVIFEDDSGVCCLYQQLTKVALATQSKAAPVAEAPTDSLLRDALINIRDYRTDVDSKIAARSMRFYAEMALTPIDEIAAPATEQAKAETDFDTTLSYAALEAMYDSQCELTDKIAAQLEARDDSVWQSRITELEANLAKVNARLIAAQASPAKPDLSRLTLWCYNFKRGLFPSPSGDLFKAEDVRALLAAITKEAGA